MRDGVPFILRKRLDKKLGEAVNLFRDWDATNSFDWNTGLIQQHRSYRYLYCPGREPYMTGVRTM